MSLLKKRTNKKLSFKEVKAKFEYRKDIILIKEHFKGWTKKSKFWDNIVQDYFWAIPRNVYNQNSAHNKRKISKIKNTLKKKYGVNNISQLDEIKQKKKQKSIEKYGTECTLKSAEVHNKTLNTWNKKYGKNKTPLHSRKVQEKIKKKNIEKYGVENPFQSPEIQKQITKTNILKYGVVRSSKLDYIKEKTIKTNLQKYGAEHYVKSNDYIKKYSKNTNRFIKETGEHVNIWLKRQPTPKPSKISIRYAFSNETIPINELVKYCENYKENKTLLEAKIEKMFNVKHYNKKPSFFATKYRPDFKLNDKIYLNVDGLYWHSEVQKDKWYHYNQRKIFENAGCKIFQFREDEIENNNEIVKSIVNNSLGKTPKNIYARKCKIAKVHDKDAKIFLKDNHIKGHIAARHIGLYFNDEIVTILSYKQIKNICKIERFCSTINTIVIGGYTKLLSYLEKNCLNENITEIHNWVDLRYGTGYHLLNKNFEIKKEPLSWQWTDFKNTYNRLKCRANMDKRGLSQQEHANELGWVKIYDAGQRLYVKK